MIYRNIVICGESGTGTSTLGKKLAEKLTWRYLSAGEFFRKWHQEHDVLIEDTLQVPSDLDKQIDFGFQSQMKNESKIVFESRLGGWLSKDLPDVYKILCIAEHDETIRRVVKREEISFDEALKQTQKRSQDLNQKFLDLYGVANSLDPLYFDWVIDTTSINAIEAFELSLLQIEKINLIK